MPESVLDLHSEPLQQSLFQTQLLPTCFWLPIVGATKHVPTDLRTSETIASDSGTTHGNPGVSE